MQILKYSNEQFAGTRGQNVEFAPGMNVVLGDNEAGKSTMIEGIYDTLLKHSKLDGRKDREFLEQRFPTNGANCIDGAVHMVVSGQEIVVKKEWDKGNTDNRTSLLMAESGTRYTGAAAEEEISRLLSFGNSVYDYLIFGRQNNETAVLDWIFSFMEEENGVGADSSMTLVREKIAGAMSAAGGISEDRFLQKLEEKLETLASHWDVSLDAPERNRGIRNPWGTKIGEILQAYYDRERKKLERVRAEEILGEMTDRENRLDELRREKARWTKKQNELHHYQGAIEKRSVLTERSRELNRRLTTMKNVRTSWPELLQESENLQALEEERKEQEARARKEELEQVLGKVARLEAERRNLLPLTEGLEAVEKDVAEFRNLETEKRTLSGTLSSARLHVKIALEKKLGATLSTADGKNTPIEMSLEEDINGFAKILLPGIGEILVSPQNLDVDEIQKQISDLEKRMTNICELYQVRDFQELKQMAENYRENCKMLQSLELQISKVLLGRTQEEIKKEQETLLVDDKLEIRSDLEACIKTALKGAGCKTIPERRAIIKTTIDSYCREYGSQEELEALIAEERNKLSEIQEMLSAQEDAEMTKEEFLRQMSEAEIALSGPDQKSGLNRELEEEITQIGRLSVEAEAIDLDALEREVEECDRKLEQKKKLYRQYLQIKEDFLALKSNQGDKFDAFYQLFNEKLSRVTKGSVSWSGDNVLKSGVNTLTRKELLSKGTRQLILLAFRLSVLEYYYREEGGVLVLDDILLDMDPGRREKAVRLLQDFADKNQVIFTTCDPAIASMLGGNVIRM